MNSQTTGQDESPIRVKATQVSSLMDMVAELSLVVSEVLYLTKSGEEEKVENATHRLNQMLRELQDQTSDLRLVEINTVFKRMGRVVRDLTKKTGKKINFVVLGEETKIDKVVVDTLADPLVHLLRNSMDHGLELADERLAAGKSEVGLLELKAKQEGSNIVITITDDGRGLNTQRIFDRAVEKGVITADAVMTDNEINELIFAPGFSTAAQVTELSGRGVGMDVVKSTILSLRGNILIENRPGNGVTLHLQIPTNLAFLDCIIVKAQNTLYAVPIESIEELLTVTGDIIKHSSVDSSNMIHLRDQLIPVRKLGIEDSGNLSAQEIEGQMICVISSNKRPVGLMVDKVYGQQQITVKPLKGYLSKINNASGCTLLPDGSVAIVIDAQSFNKE